MEHHWTNEVDVVVSCSDDFKDGSREVIVMRQSDTVINLTMKVGCGTIRNTVHVHTTVFRLL
jgi:hypothetical protein